MPGAWPTHEQYLDVFAGAIVATCRSVLNTPTPVRRLGENGVRIGATVEMAMSYEEVALACAGRPFEAQKPATRKAPLSTRRQRLRYLELHPEVTHAQDKVELLKNAGLVARSTYWRDVYV